MARRGMTGGALEMGGDEIVANDLAAFEGDTCC